MRNHILAVLSALLIGGSPAVAATYPAPVEGDYVIRNFKFATGEVLPELRIHYRTIGTPQRDAAGVVRNAVLLLHGTSGTGANFLDPAFAGQLFEQGQLLDGNTHFIIMPDGIGVGQSSKPSDGLRAKFPRYAYADMVEAQHGLLTEKLGRHALAAAARHVDGRDAHVDVGRDLSRFHGRAHGAGEQSRRDRRTQSRLSEDDHRFDSHRSGLA